MRPTKYNEEMQAKADEYVNGGYIACDDAVPSKVGLALELGVSLNTLENWGKDHPKFLSTLENCLSKQHRVALSGGLKGDFNAAITKLLLHNHGYSEKHGLEHTGKGGGPVETVTTIEIVAGSDKGED